MAQFLQSYGIWIILGVLFLVTVWRRARGHGHGGMGCGMGGNRRDEDQPVGEKDGQQSHRHSSGCH